MASSKQLAHERLAHLIVEIYQNQRGVPGYRQMQIILEQRCGVKCNLKRVHRLMRSLDLRAVCRRKKRTRRRKLPAEYLAENILDKSFTAGFSLGQRNNISLVFEAFEQAFQQYPDAYPLVHSDRGSQYTSHAFQKRMEEAGIHQSMSRPGKCLDNAPMEFLTAGVDIEAETTSQLFLTSFSSVLST